MTLMEFQKQVQDSKQFASQFFKAEATVKIEEYTEERFRNPNCPSVTNGTKITFNKAWIEAGLPNSDDVPFFLIHELRHIYQHDQITKYESGLTTQESERIIKRWKHEWENYIPNLGDSQSRARNLSQEIEKDANGYSMALLILKHMNEPWSLNVRMEEDQVNLSFRRAHLYIETKLELTNWRNRNYISQ